ncbi:MAG: tetratricopeptide repeat protein [bacterium]|nr:tetratricopeptide repeat protein [bacterium]MDT8365329.1 tetratricopeptide repeat protein [bacterium]
MTSFRFFMCAFLAITVVSCAGVSVRESLVMPYEDRIQLASIYIQGGQQDQAIPLLEDAITQEEGRPEACAMLGELFWLKGDLKKSSIYFEKALETGGEDPMILNNLAWIEFEKDNPDRALALVDRAIAMDPAPLYPYLETRTRTLMKLHRYDEAAVDARAAFSLTPEYDTRMKEQLGELISEIERLKDGLEDNTY